MTKWITPITDRSILDITVKTPKAYLNVTDLSRIESNIAYLSKRLSLLGYRIKQTIPIDWAKCGVPRVADIQRICESILEIVNVYHKPCEYTDLSGIPNKPLHFTDINAIEQNLSQILSLIEQGLTHDYLSRLTHGQLRSYTHAQIRTGGVTTTN